MEIYKYISSRYLLILFLVVLVSYGQMLQMDIWKDDNAIFFKFNHLNEMTGYLGRGLFGEGPYKFSVTPYYFIYKFFGTQLVWPYYLLTLSFYFLATVSVYKLFSELISEKSGKLAGLLFAGGYIASEGFLWLASSMIQSVSIILTCATLIAYYKFLNSRNIRIFFAAVLLYLLTLFMTPVRTHYLFILLVLFELLWFRRFSWIFGGRVLLLFLIFFKFYLESADSRTYLISGFFQDILSGNFYKLYSLLGSLGNMVIPLPQLLYIGRFEAPVVEVLFVLLTTLLIYLKYKKITAAAFLLTQLFIIWLSYQITSNPHISVSFAERLAVFLGGYTLVLLFTLIIFSKNARMLIFLTCWMLLNLLVYSAYLPTSLYPSTDRYLAHSFVPLVGILSLAASAKGMGKFLLSLVILLGVINLFNSLVYQRGIVLNRSIPVRNFYLQLKDQMPYLSAGHLIYFDVADNSIRQFEAAFSVGQMPDETALAWRYGVDRYDIKMFTDFDKFAQNSKGVDKDKIHTFYYSKDGLVDTTAQFFEYQGKVLNLSDDLPKKSIYPDGLEIILKEPFSSVLPTKISLILSARPLALTNLAYPLKQGGNQSNPIFHDRKLSKLAFEYQKYKLDFQNNAEILVSSEWSDRVLKNIFDNDETTVWQADRVRWQSANEEIIVDLKAPVEVDRLLWVNGFPNNTPTNYHILASDDGLIWKNIKSVEQFIRINDKSPQIIPFPRISTRFVKMQIIKTIDDSPAIAEIMVIPARFSEMDILQTEEFLLNPFGYIKDADTYKDNLAESNLRGEAKLFWLSDKFTDWRASKIHITFDGKPHQIYTTIPPGGTRIKSIKIGDIQIPAEVELYQVHASWYLNE